MQKYILAVLLAIAIIAFVRLSCYTVDAGEYAYVTVLGEHRETHDGGTDGAGLHFGWPWPIQQVQRFDRRLQHFDLQEIEQLTHDPKGNTVDKILLLDAYVCWKISDEKGVDLFVRSVGNQAKARQILGPEITGKLGAAVGQRRMDDFINISFDPQTGKTKVDHTVEKLHDELLAGLKDRLRDKFGIELVDIRLRRFNHPASVRESIFNRIKSERSKEAQKYESDGAFQASLKISEATEKVRTDEAQARREEENIKAETDIAAMKIRNEAFDQDREFYKFLKTMEQLQAIVGDKKTFLLLSTHRPMFESMFKEPRPAVQEKK